MLSLFGEIIFTLVFLMGFSQGAIMSLYAGLHTPEIIRALAPMSGRLLPETIAAVRFIQNPEPDFWRPVRAPSGDENAAKNAANKDGFVIMVDGAAVDRVS